MKFFSNMTIRLKLFSGFSIILFFMVAIGLTGYQGVNSIQGRLNSIFEVRMPAIDHLLQADRDLQQLLVAERSMIFTNSKSEKFRDFVKAYEKNLEQAAQRWDKYKTLATTDEEKNMIAGFEAARKEWMAVSRQIVDARIADTRQGRRLALDLTTGLARDKFETMRDYLNRLTEINQEYTNSDHNSANKANRDSVVTIASISGLAFILGAALMVLISKGVAGPLKLVLSGLTDISQGEGDLTSRLNYRGKDEVGQLAQTFDRFIEKLQDMIRDISGNVTRLTEAAAAFLSLSEEMTRGSSTASEKSRTVAAAVEEIDVTMNSISSAMETSAGNTNSVASAAEEMNSTVDEIARNAAKARGISEEAVSKVEGTTREMDSLSQAAQAIGKVVETITDISEQVNLLSLNATIEAARAGEAGKGFAVVANEIKVLASQTSTASNDIKARIENIQETAQGATSGISEISQVIHQVDDIISAIAASVEEQASVTREISSNISQVSAGIQDINENVSQNSTVVSDVSREIADVSRSAGEINDRSSSVRTSAEDLTAIAENLKNMMDKFKI
ncbi:methyl-accepting chemotaxis protein [Desulfobacter vibrioformis]|uniref:methyl-accepting chemotaxis protein n=1 Tax=Desulfobacter vibrioformis TaxID=34031 RepID=UPI000691E891|nr:methyl-accepting chemotaxis protein [Desulfobacter vibrioformis]